MHKAVLSVKKVRVHNLKGVDLILPIGAFIVFTGVSGSGKSSMAFDTLYAEGQRRYIESLSTHLWHYFEQLPKPDLESAEGLAPTFAIEQSQLHAHPRSTVGTITEIYDYMRILFAKAAVPYCPVSNEPLSSFTKEEMIGTIQKEYMETISVLAPLCRDKKGTLKEETSQLKKKGFHHVRIDGTSYTLTDLPNLDPNKAHDLDLVIDTFHPQQNPFQLSESVSTALELGTSLIILSSHGEKLFSTIAFSPSSGLSYPPLTPSLFSFNHPQGMCEFCYGLGWMKTFNLDRILDPYKNIQEDFCSISSSFHTVKYGNIYKNLARIYHFSLSTPWRELPESVQQVILYGTSNTLLMHFTHPTKQTHWKEYIQWKGIIPEALERYHEAKSSGYKKKMEELMHSSPCRHCQQSRLKPYPSAARFTGERIHDLTSLPITSLIAWFHSITLDPHRAMICQDIIAQILQRLQFISNVGLGYLSLNRSTTTLSGGEAQRIRLAAYLGSGLSGMIYILDEPSIGLHARDHQCLIETLMHIKQLGNTVIVVEHDEQTMRAADRIVDFGPRAGTEGGEILVNGSLEEVMHHPSSLTGAYLSGRLKFAIPEHRQRTSQHFISLTQATLHNLKGVDIRFPTGHFIAITGVSGSGKSSLILETLVPAIQNHLTGTQLTIGPYQTLKGVEMLDKIITIDQSPIGRTSRSNPATYLKILDEIRKLFSQLPESRARGYAPGRFSFNVSTGSCPHCHGTGELKIDMDFMSDISVPCPSCEQKKFDEETLSILYKGKNIYEVLQMTVQEALDFFGAIHSIARRLQMLVDIGLSYITLGQSATTLSGGEAQRMKLAKELSRPQKDHTLYVLDEPTTGLHFFDIQHLLHILHQLVDRGHTVMVIEHHIDLIKTADWIIDLGPEGGELGGYITGMGSVEEIMRCDTPTGRALSSKTPPYEGKYSTIYLSDTIHIEGASQNNLKSLNVSIPKNAMTVCTGPSGSGKSSFAFDTLFNEGQRRYFDTLSTWAKQCMHKLPPSHVLRIQGLSPTIAIEQKHILGNHRSTVATVTETYDYLRLLFTHIGVPHCPETGEKIQEVTKQDVMKWVYEHYDNEKITILAPLSVRTHKDFVQLCSYLRQRGFVTIKLNAQLYDLDGEIPFPEKEKIELSLFIDQFLLKSSSSNRLYEGISQALAITKKEVIIAAKEEHLFRMDFSVPSTGVSYPRITPSTFSFNHPDGMCPVCQGSGVVPGASFFYDASILSLSFFTLANQLWVPWTLELIELCTKAFDFDPYLPLSALPQKITRLIIEGNPLLKIPITPHASLRFCGLKKGYELAARQGEKELREKLHYSMEDHLCAACDGLRLNRLAQNVRIQEHSLPTLIRLPIGTIHTFLSGIELSTEQKLIVGEVVEQLSSRLAFLEQVGLGYITLDRNIATLSQGEIQRIRLAKQLGSSLRGIVYILDEPTIGLHPHDIARLQQCLTQLQALGNTLVMVEHDTTLIKQADYILDFGPSGGSEGGYILAQGSLEEILRNPHSITAPYLNHTHQIPFPTTRRTIQETLTLSNVSSYNLKHFTITIPLKVWTCITGVSGSGKSTLLHQEIVPFLKKSGLFTSIHQLDQRGIGNTVRSDVSTYSELAPLLRNFYTSLPASKTRGLTSSHFSCNTPEGMCQTCRGLGYQKIQLILLPEVQVPCQECKGYRLTQRSLEVEYHHMHFGAILAKNIQEIKELFPSLPKVQSICHQLISVGLGYLRLDQEVNSLSGGEGQRLRLSRELAAPEKARTLYILDEPTTGLHPRDIEHLIIVLHQLVNHHATMIMIEHHPDMIKQADYIVELGPTAGIEGGHLLFTGSYEEMLSSPSSITGRYCSPCS